VLVPPECLNLHLLQGTFLPVEPPCFVPLFFVENCQWGQHPFRLYCSNIFPLSKDTHGWGVGYDEQTPEVPLKPLDARRRIPGAFTTAANAALYATPKELRSGDAGTAKALKGVRCMGPGGAGVGGLVLIFD